MVAYCVLLRWITWNLMERRSVDAIDARMTPSKPMLHFLLVSIKPTQLGLMGSHLCPPWPSFIKQARWPGTVVVLHPTLGCMCGSWNMHVHVHFQHAKSGRRKMWWLKTAIYIIVFPSACLTSRLYNVKVFMTAKEWNPSDLETYTKLKILPNQYIDESLSVYWPLFLHLSHCNRGSGWF